MFLKPGGIFAFQSLTNSPSTGALSDADALPTATLTKNGVDDGAVTCTVVKLSTGRYKITGTIPGSGYVAGDVCNIVVFATVGGVAGASVAGEFVVDTKFVSNLNDAAALTDYQQRGVAVMLPTLPNVTVGGYATGQTPDGLVWGANTRTLSSFGTLVSDIATAVWGAAARTLTAVGDSSGITTLLSRIGSALTISSGKVAATVNGTTDLTGVIPGTVLANAPTGSGGGGLTTPQATQLATAAAIATSAPSWWVSPDNADIATSLADLVTLLARADTASNVSAVKTVTDKLATMLQGSGPYAYTSASLTNAPSGGSGSGPTAVQIRQEMDANSTQLAALVSSIALANGMLGLNSAVRNPILTGGNLTAYDLCIYDTPSHATTNDGTTGLLHKLHIVLGYSGSTQNAQTVTQVS